jgi:hypothetical protein
MSAITFKKTQTDSEIQQLVTFLTKSVVFTGDGEYFTVAGPLCLSYYSTPDYWGDYVCNTWAGQNNQDCAVVVQDFGGGSDPYYRNGQGSPGAQLQIERTDATLGTDIYDAACWQIALGLAASQGLQGFQPTSLFSLASNTTQRLQPDVKAIRANTSNFQYGYLETLSNANLAYALRLVGEGYWAQDPLWKTKYQGYITFSPPCIRYKRGSITWPDWKPITGENAWAFFLGALQLDNWQYQSQGYIPFKSTSIQNALYVLCAFSLMQSSIGAFYYAPGGSEGNAGGPVPVGEISVENCASSLAGLTILRQVLEITLKQDPSLSAVDQAILKAGINIICIMIWGGRAPCDTGQTAGLLSFLKNYAWNASRGVFFQGGIYTYTNKSWTPTEEPQAVDVNTWGLTVLGPRTLDQWFGAGTAFNIWQQVKPWGGFSQNGQLWGVGYSDQDNNSVMSAEWTAGAINAVRCLMVYYQADTNRFSSLQADHDSMMTHLLNLRTDRYVGAGFPNGLDSKSFTYVKPPSGQLAFLYASQRYNIPFGWYANPIPSTTSTSWTIFLHYDYNPFQLGGSYDSLVWTAPSYDPTNQWGPWTIGSVSLTVQNNVTDAEIMPSCQLSDGADWQNLLDQPIRIGGQATIRLPSNAYGFMVVYNVPGKMPSDQWLRACVLNQKQISDLQSGQTISAIWTNSEGTGACLTTC